LTAAGAILAGHPHPGQRFRHNWIPIGGVDGDTVNYEGHMGIDRADMPQLSGMVNGQYRPSREMTPKFLQQLRDQGVKVEAKRVPAESLKPTQTAGDRPTIRRIADQLKSGQEKNTKPIVVSSDNRVLDGHHNWAARVLADRETGQQHDMPVHQVDMPMDQLLDEARQFGAKHGIASRGLGVAGNPSHAPTAAAALVAARGHHTKGGPFHWRHGWIPIGGEGGGGTGVPPHHVAREVPRLERKGPLDEQQFTSRPDIAPKPGGRPYRGLFGEPPKERKGPLDEQQFTSRPDVAPKPGTVPYKGLFDDAGKGKKPYGGLFGEPGKQAQPKHQPLSDAQYQAHTQKVEQAVRDAIARGDATDSKYGVDVAAGVWQPQRAEVHRQLVDDIYNRQAATAKSTGDALIMGGLGGAGKSTVLKNHLGLNQADWVTINPDDVKEEMARRGLVPQVPGLSPMEASALIHEESSHIANLIAARALADHKNVIYDITMSSKGSVQKRLDKLKEHGYKKPQGVFVDIPVETSVQRALGRHRSGMEEFRQGKGLGGRYVPPSVIRESGSAGSSNSANRDVFDTLAGQFGTRRVFDTSGAGVQEIPLAGQQGEASIANAANRKALGR
jgi:hypothetical protein